MFSSRGKRGQKNKSSVRERLGSGDDSKEPRARPRAGTFLSTLFDKPKPEPEKKVSISNIMVIPTQTTEDALDIFEDDQSEDYRGSFMECVRKSDVGLPGDRVAAEEGNKSAMNLEKAKKQLLRQTTRVRKSSSDIFSSSDVLLNINGIVSQNKDTKTATSKVANISDSNMQQVDKRSSFVETNIPKDIRATPAAVKKSI